MYTLGFKCTEHGLDTTSGTNLAPEPRTPLTPACCNNKASMANLTLKTLHLSLTFSPDLHSNPVAKSLPHKKENAQNSETSLNNELDYEQMERNNSNAHNKLTTTLFFSFSVVLHLMLLVLIYLQL
jgi:hypothetical protein